MRVDNTVVILFGGVGLIFILLLAGVSVGFITHRVEYPFNYLVYTDGSETYLLDGSTGETLDSNSNQTLVQEWALGNNTEGVIFLKDQQLNSTLEDSIGANETVLENYQNEISVWGQVTFEGDIYYNGDNRTAVLAAPEETAMGNITFTDENSTYVNHTLTGVPNWVGAAFNVTVCWSWTDKNSTHFQITTETPVNATCYWRAIKRE